MALHNIALQETVKDIIARRNNTAIELRAEEKAIGRKINALRSLKQNCIAAKEYEEYRQLLEVNKGLREAIENMADIDACILAYEDAQNEIRETGTRFERQTLNVSAVGDSRSGKSKFLQTVSGLNNKCIPSHEGTFCTGVRSIIENKEGEGAEAVITLKNETEILGEINDKLNFITGGKVRIGSFDELKSLGEKYAQNAGISESDTDEKKCHPYAEYLMSKEILRQDKDGNMAKGRINDFVAMYITNQAKWIDLVENNLSEETLDKYKLEVRDAGKREFVCRDENEIEQFVAKRDAGTEEKHGADAKPFYRYIAVRGAVIYAEFKLTDMRQLRLVDTVGLGDLAEETTEKMHEVIGGESDAVIYFFCPDELKGGMVDDKTAKMLNYDILNRYEKRAMNKWMAVLINHKVLKSGWDNEAQCVSFLENFRNAVPAMTKNVVFTEIINVSREEQVRDRCLTPLLTSLLNHIEDVDRVFREDTEKKLKEAKAKADALSERFAGVRIPEADDIINSNFKKMFRNFTEKVQEYSNETALQPGVEDSLLDRSLDAVENLMSTAPHIETENYITTETIYESLGHVPNMDSKKVIALNTLQSAVRDIGRSSSEDLKEKERAIKETVADIFLTEFHFERKEMPAYTDPYFFKKASEELFGNEEEFEFLRDVFLSMNDFKLNEADGIVKLLFNDCADRYILNTEAGTALMKDKEEKGKKEKTEEKSAPASFVFSDDGEDMAETPQEPAGQAQGETQNSLIREMDERIKQFIGGVKASEFYKLPSVVPLGSQIGEELRYFLRCFDVGYQREWAVILNQQMKKGHVFRKEKEEIDNKVYLYRQFSDTLTTCFEK